MHKYLLATLPSLLGVAPMASAQDGHASSAEKLQHFVFIGGSELAEHRDLLERDDIDGAQVIYTWRALEPREGEFNFSKIERDLALADSLGKKLFVQVQDRFFLPEARNIPDYVLSEPVYGGGLVRQEDNAGEGEAKGSGWVSAQWNPHVRGRFQALLVALGERFDGRIYGVNLPETAIEVQTGDGAPEGFSCDAYFHAEMENLITAREAFDQSFVVQYANFWPCEWNNSEGYMARIFDYALAAGVGIGGPDIVPFKRAQEKNSYQYLKRLGDQLPIVAMAVQGPTLTYTNPKTGQKFTREEFESYAVSELNVDIIFWSLRVPWLQASKAE
ncbi:hypothetical protein [Pontixanthobacter sp. CEM42]|uniref:hypothetical protein n=1 Tax=Pontixanthobacter sp. CEM42 TaxID=2792077 RepID=UPI001FD7E289|nr:hypothetical protein [Pontixanthobacter sp. CEM42]